MQVNTTQTWCASGKHASAVFHGYSKAKIKPGGHSPAWRGKFGIRLTGNIGYRINVNVLDHRAIAKELSLGSPLAQSARKNRDLGFAAK